jgi:DNA-binding beta-propeller fold protein YncE
MLADRQSILAAVVSPDARTLFAMTYGKGAIYGYDLATLQPTPGSGAAFSGPTQFDYEIAVSADGALVLQVTNPMGSDYRDPGQLVLLHASNLQPAPGSPVTLAEGAWLIVVGRQAGRWYFATTDGIIALDQATRQPVWPQVLLPQPAYLAVSADEGALYALTTDLNTRLSILTRIDGATGRVTSQIPVSVGGVIVLPIGGLALTPDGGTLFLCGIDFKNSTEGNVMGKLNAYDANTLEELSWSPVSFGSIYASAIALTPDGTRLLATAGPSLNQLPSPSLLAAEPEFD